MKSYPAGSPQEDRVELERVLGSIQAINTCLPQTGANDSGTAASTAGLLNGCSTLLGAFSVFVLQMRTFVCWIWGKVEALQTQVMRTPGDVSIAPSAGLGSGGTASIVGNDTAGTITLVTGSGPTTGEQAAITFDTPFSTAGVLLLIPNNVNAINANLAGASSQLVANTTTDGVSLVDLQAPLPAGTYIYNYVVLGGT